VKQALFAIIEAERDDAWEVTMLDAFAGSGAAAIEALSRGAPGALLIESDAKAAAVARANLAQTGLDGRARILERDAIPVLRAGADALAGGGAPFGVVLLDPPYERSGLLTASLTAVGDPGFGWLDDDACVVAKHFWRDRPPEVVGSLRLARERRFGETALSVYRRVTEPEGSDSR
jgi:16S rRNA (guanine966-N2)-methyltransferase